MYQSGKGRLEPPATMAEPVGRYAKRTIQDEPAEAWSPLAGVVDFVANLFTVHGFFAAAIWLAGVYCTYQVTADLLSVVTWAWVAAFITQGALTLAESPIWRPAALDEDGKPYKRDRGVLNWVALGVDAGLNLVGTWAVVGRFHTFEPVQAVGAMFETTVQPARGFPALLLCAVLSLFLCGLPEYIWHQD
jgi:hypothetical protein